MKIQTRMRKREKTGKINTLLYNKTQRDKEEAGENVNEFLHERNGLLDEGISISRCNNRSSCRETFLTRNSLSTGEEMEQKVCGRLVCRICKTNKCFSLSGEEEEENEFSPL